MSNRIPQWTASVLLAAATTSSAAVVGQVGPLSNSTDVVPGAWTGRKFELSKDYPTTLPPLDPRPWRSFDFKTKPREYIQAVLGYAFAGNLAVDWVVQNNATRKWFHAPGFAVAGGGREFIRGMTEERPSRPGELHPNQTSQFRNFGIGFYNPRGGFTLGRVWAQPTSPDPTQGRFREGTVAFKLLFTTATAAQVPWLEGAPEWEANINHNMSGATAPRVRLLQVDVAVRDNHANATTGWLFGTFVYQSNPAQPDPWQRLVPVGLMWGNAPDLTPDTFATGSRSTEQWINPDVTMQHLGWLGRLDGPIDNPLSSCLSCHSTAGWPSGPMVPSSTASLATKMTFFRNVPAAQPFRTGQQSLDYSLQLMIGIRNHPGSHPTPAIAPVAAVAASPSIAREGEESSGEEHVPEYPPSTRAVVDEPEDGDAPVTPPVPSVPSPDTATARDSGSMIALGIGGILILLLLAWAIFGRR